MLTEKCCDGGVSSAWKKLGTGQVLSSIIAIMQSLETGRELHKSLWSRHLFLIIGVRRADLKHSGKMPHRREELNRSVRDGRMESWYSTKELGRNGIKGRWSMSWIKMYSLAVVFDTFWNEEGRAIPTRITSVGIKITGYTAMFVLISTTLMLICLVIRLGSSALWEIVDGILGGCLFESVSTIWCISLLEDDRAIFHCKIDIQKFAPILKNCSFSACISLWKRLFCVLLLSLCSTSFSFCIQKLISYD